MSSYHNRQILRAKLIATKDRNGKKQFDAQQRKLKKARKRYLNSYNERNCACYHSDSEVNVDFGFRARHGLHSLVKTRKSSADTMDLLRDNWQKRNEYYHEWKYPSIGSIPLEISKSKHVEQPAIISGLKKRDRMKQNEHQRKRPIDTYLDLVEEARQILNSSLPHDLSM